jgi:hypothetical protein
MIIESVFNLLFGLVNIIVGLLPTLPTMPSFINNTLDLFSKAFQFIPSDIWIAMITSASLWFVVQFGWAVIEWVYKKIPGIN